MQSLSALVSALGRKISRRAIPEIAQACLDLSSDIVVMIDGGGRVSRINPAGLRLLGYREAEIVGRDWCSSFVAEHHRERTRRSLRERGSPGQHEAAIVTRGGDERIIGWRFAEISGGLGKPPATLCSGTDLTELRRLERARAVAESATRAKSRFLANMSHDLRTPMSGLMGMLALLFDTPLDDRQRRFAATAQRSARNLLELLNDILDLSKIEAGKLELETVDLNLRQLVDEVAEIFAEACHEKGLELLCLVRHDTPAALRGDPVRLRQVLSNLISNAVKFTDRGEIQVRVSPVEVEDRALKLRFEVQDTGVGLPPEARAVIFEAFQQADDSQARKYGGTGLGLSIARQLAVRMGGTVGAEAVPGGGSVFWFTAALERQPDASGILRLERFDDPAPRLLVVDDNAASRESLASQLRAWNAVVELAPDGPQAVQMLLAAAIGGEPFDLALLDLQMPGMDGLTLARTIQSAPLLHRLPRVLLTPVTPPAGNLLRQAGIVRHLAKPVRSPELYDCVAELTAAREGREAEARAVAPPPQLQEVGRKL